MAAETASNEMVMGLVLALCELTLLVSRQNHSDLSRKAVINAPYRCYKKKDDFWEQRMSKSAKANEDNLLATKSHQLLEQTIQKIRTAMEALESGAEMVSPAKRRLFKVRLNRAR